MNEVKALLLCNNPIAVPGIKEFLFYGKVAAVAIPARNKEMKHILQQLLGEPGVPLLLLDKKNYRDEIARVIREKEVNVCLMMTFPFIITKELLAMPEKGFINFHYGLLPSCRGPHPILWHMLNNDKEAGITIHKVDEGIDTGPVVMQEKIAIEENDTYGTLQTRLAFLAAKLAANLLKILSFGKIIPATQQDTTGARYFEMPSAAALTINWKEMDAAAIIRLINACNPWNKGAGTTINNWLIGITEAVIAGEQEDDNAPGTVIYCDTAKGLVIKSRDNKLLTATIIYTNEGFFSGSRLFMFGIRPGMQFE